MDAQARFCVIYSQNQRGEAMVWNTAAMGLMLFASQCLNSHTWAFKFILGKMKLLPA